MAFENLYQLNEEQYQNLPARLGEAFFLHPLFCRLFPNAQVRKTCITYFMSQYLKLLAPYALCLAESEAMHAVIIVYDSRRYVRKEYWRALLQMDFHLLALVKQLGIRDMLHFIKELESLSKRWVIDFERKAYFYVELVFASEMHHKEALQLVRELIDEGDIMDMNVAVKTSDKESALWYERLGFTLMNTIVDEESGLDQYCLIAKHHKEQKSWIQDIG